MDESRIRLMHHDPRWRQEFEQTRSSILQSCLGWVTAVEHVGSTAISGLIAQPTIDLLAGVTATEGFDPAASQIEGLNFRRVDSPEWAADTVTLWKPRHGQVTHQVFLTIIDSPAWQRSIRLRDWLRGHPETAVRFEEAKVRRWRDGEGDPRRYQADKAVFFAHLEDQIEAGGPGEYHE